MRCGGRDALRPEVRALGGALLDRDRPQLSRPVPECSHVRRDLSPGAAAGESGCVVDVEPAVAAREFGDAGLELFLGADFELARAFA
jgi:hypothetical protein